jgi:hypothetical protein
MIKCLVESVEVVESSGILIKNSASIRNTGSFLRLSGLEDPFGFVGRQSGGSRRQDDK